MASAMPAASAEARSPRRTREPACFRWGEMICCAAKIARFRLLGFITFPLYSIPNSIPRIQGNVFIPRPHCRRGLVTGANYEQVGAAIAVEISGHEIGTVFYRRKVCGRLEFTGAFSEQEAQISIVTTRRIAEVAYR